MEGVYKKIGIGIIMYTGILLLSCMVLVELVGYYLLHDMGKGRALDWCYHQG